MDVFGIRKKEGNSILKKIEKEIIDDKKETGDMIKEAIDSDCSEDELFFTLYVIGFVSGRGKTVEEIITNMGMENFEKYVLGEHKGDEDNPMYG